MFTITNDPVELETLKNEVRNDAAGALVTFEGWVRNHNEGKPVSSLEYEAYHDLCLSEATKVIEEAREKFDILDVTAIHRVGHLAIGDIAVWIGVSAKHRQAAFHACQYVIDEIKLRLPIWKKEHYVDGHAEWVNCQGCYQHAHHHNSENDYYDKQLRIRNIGPIGQDKLRRAKVLVVGAGGLGCPSLTYLAAAGVGKITVVDDDKLEISNLHRQTLYAHADIGEYKAILAKKRLNGINPFIDVEVMTERLEIDNVLKVVKDHDVILDCTDNFKAKFLIHDACFLERKVLVQASIYQTDGVIQTYDFSSNAGSESGCQRCLWPEMPNQTDVGNCAEVGVIGVVPAMLGVMQATEAIKVILGWPVASSDHSLFVDLTNWEITKAKRGKEKSCSLCGVDPSISGIEGKNYAISEVQLNIGALLKLDLNEFELIDIRDHEERHLCSPWENCMIHVSDYDFKAPLKAPLKKMVLVCSKGVRSIEFAERLRAEGLKDVYSLDDGVTGLKQNWDKLQKYFGNNK